MSDTSERDTGNELTPELAAVAAGLDAMGTAARERPEAGFEDRIAAMSVREGLGGQPLRLVISRADAGERRVGAALARIAACLLLAGGAAGIVWLAVWGGQDAMNGDRLAAGALTTQDEISEIVDAWDALDDTEWATRLDELHTLTTSVSQTVGEGWDPSAWIEEESM